MSISSSMNHSTAGPLDLHPATEAHDHHDERPHACNDGWITLGRLGKGILRGVSALDLGGRRWWTMSRLLRVGEKVINLDNIEYIIREDDGVVRIHFIHGDIALWNEQG